MLTIFEITSAADAKRYYSGSDYYSQGQETIGSWGGKLAERLGLSGPVAKADFDRMCDNLHPATGERLTVRTRENRRVGYDFTVSAPKSVSIVRAFALRDDAQAMDAARDRAIAGMMATVEADMGCRVRKGGADVDRGTGSMAWAAFHHTTSRPIDGQPPDMHEHTHLVCFNATFDPVERRVKAGQFGPLKRDGEYYAALFDSLYAAELEKIGFVIDRQGGKRWEISGVSASMVSTFSKRTREVEAEAERRGIVDAGRKAELGAKTRAKKQKELTPSQLRRTWDDQLSDADREALARVFHREIEPGRQVTVQEAVAFAIAHLSEQRSVWGERELLAVALRHGLGQVSLEAIQAELPRHGVIVDEIDGRRMATTHELQAEENYLVRVAAAGRGAVEPVGVPEGLSRLMGNGKSLNDGQWKAAQGVLNSSNLVTVVEGPAGAGKSSMLAKVDEGWRERGETVTYLATTAPAVGVLVKDGFNAKTLAHFLRDERMQQAAAGGRVVIDEVSMLGHKDAVELFRLVEKLDLKLVLVGDQFQHSSVPRGAFMRLLKDFAGIKSHRLTEIMRQQDADYRAAAQSLSEGKTLEGFDRLDAKGWVAEIADGAERYAAMAAEYVRAVEDDVSCLVVSPTHREAAAITAEIRSQLRQAGRLEEEEHRLTRLVDTNASEPERGLASTYRPGDVLIFHQNAKGGFVKGQRFVVTDPAAVPLGEAARFTLHREEAIGLSVGDKIRFTGTVTARDGSTFRNGDTHTIAAITPGKSFRLDNGKLVGADCGLFRSAWVETSFGSQGRTVQRVILGMAAASSPATNQEQMYVSSTRAREKLSLYTDDKETVRGAILKSSQKLLALDVKAKPAVPMPARLRWWDRLRTHFERRRRETALGVVRAAEQVREWSQERQVSGGYGR